MNNEAIIKKFLENETSLSNDHLRIEFNKLVYDNTCIAYKIENKIYMNRTCYTNPIAKCQYLLKKNAKNLVELNYYQLANLVEEKLGEII